MTNEGDASFKNLKINIGINGNDEYVNHIDEDMESPTAKW